jgi:hypothetical protein
MLALRPLSVRVDIDHCEEPAGASGTVTGTRKDGGITDLRARQVNRCPGEFVGAVLAEAGNTLLRGEYAGSDCGGAVTASFEAIRQ